MPKMIAEAFFGRPMKIVAGLIGAGRPLADDFDLDHLVFDATGKRLDADLIDSVVDTSWELTIEGSSSVTITLEDSDGDLMDSALLTRWAWGEKSYGEDGWMARGRKIDVRMAGLVFRLAKVTGQGTQVTLTFEDRAVAVMREYRGAKTALRSKMTRAMFALSLVREIKRPRIKVYSPELYIPQPIAPFDTDTSKAPDDEPSTGIDTSARLTVKGVRATPRQIGIAEEVLGSVDEQFPKAPHRAKVALLCAVTHESVMGTLGMTPATISDGTSVGILQALTSNIPADKAMDIDYNVRRFMAEPWTGTSLGGAIKQAKAGRSVGDICESIQGNSTGDVFTQWIDEANAWLDAWGGGGGRANLEKQIVKPYKFERKKNENTWDCLGRLFEEVNWRRFMRRDKLWIISEEDLFRQKPVYQVRAGQDGIDWIDLELDMRTRSEVQTLELTARAGAWTVLPGHIVVVRDRGPAKGRWLVAKVAGRFGDDAVQVTLVKPMREKPEPAPETDTRTVGSGTTDVGATASSDVEAVYLECLRISKKNYPYIWGGGHGTAGKPDGGTGRDPGIGYDCSGYTAAGLLAGNMLPNEWKNGVPASGTFASSWGKPGEGKEMTVWANAEHVWIEFHLKGRNGTRADTSPHGSGGSGPHMRYTRRSTAGFTPRQPA